MCCVGGVGHICDLVFIPLAHDTLNGALGLEQWGIHVTVMKGCIWRPRLTKSVSHPLHDPLLDKTFLKYLIILMIYNQVNCSVISDLNHYTLTKQIVRRRKKTRVSCKKLMIQYICGGMIFFSTFVLSVMIPWSLSELCSKVVLCKAQHIEILVSFKVFKKIIFKLLRRMGTIQQGGKLRNLIICWCSLL